MSLSPICTIAVRLVLRTQYAGKDQRPVMVEASRHLREASNHAQAETMRSVA